MLQWKNEPYECRMDQFKTISEKEEEIAKAEMFTL